MHRLALIAGSAVLVVACGGDSGTAAPPYAAYVYIERNGVPVDSVLPVDAFGTIRLTALVLNPSRVEMSPGTYTISWATTAPGVAGVNADGTTDVTANGSALVIVRADKVADTVRLVVNQQATQARVQQDTVVAFTPGATALDGSAAVDSMRFTAVRTDANGNAAPSSGTITWDVVDTSMFAIVPNAGGDTVAIVGKAVGAARLAIHFGTYTDTLPVQVASAYKTVGYTVIPGGIVVTPSSVTIPAGAAVVFRNPEASATQVLGTGWRVGPILPVGREGQVFGTPGTYPFTIGSGNGSVTVTP
jgi:hypothetical protein